METAALGTYLNDHLAGSVAALDLMHRLRSFTDDPDLLAGLSEIRAQVKGERAELEMLIARLGVGQTRVRRAAVWCAAMLGRLKLHRGGETARALHLFQGLEMLLLAVSGKRALWLALAETQSGIPALAGVDYPRLIAQSTAQRDTFERLRLRAAHAAFRPAPEGAAS